MSASDHTLIGCTLFAMCVVCNGDATATEPVKPAAASTSTNSLPAFLDERRLADIQEVWDARAAQSGPTRDAQQLAKAQATMQTARAAMKRAQQASEDAAVVRRRAEEISRRFSTGVVTTTVTTTPAGAGGAEIAPVATVATVATVQPAADTGAPAVPQVEHAAAVHAPPLDADSGPARPFGVGGPLPADPTESAPSVAAIEADTTAKPIPPTPHRAPRAGAAKAPRSKAKIGSSPKPSSKPPSSKPKADASGKLAANTRPPAAVANARPPEPAANAAKPLDADENKSTTMSDVYSGFLRAFGWNSQPD